MVRAVSGGDVPGWVMFLHLAVLALVLSALLANRRLPGVPIVAAGLAVNTLVIALNGGLMPRAPETLYVSRAGASAQLGQHVPLTKGVVLRREDTRLWWLSDVLMFPEGLPVRGVFSAGDVVIAGGLAWVVCGLMRAGATTARATRGEINGEVLA
jgi:hypothetical protein